MKRIALIIILISLANILNAQPPKGEKPSTEQLIQHATQELNLSENQVAKWEEIHAKYAAKIESEGRNSSSRDDMQAELKATLSKDQLKKFKELGSKNKGHGAGGPPPR